ncbi:MAG TPA: o-succinylbenzoate synthase [Actinomycetota bacterium]|nr:o-succinylbenzoate synthase [Actinomycetota bacterium]
MITLRAAELVRADLPLVRPFRTSFGVQELREAVLVRVVCDVEGVEAEGWGECVAGSDPFYSAEWGLGAWVLLREVLLPMLAEEPLTTIEDTPAAMSEVRGNRMAKAAAEMAITDAALRARGVSLKAYLGGERDRVECGVSIGIMDSPDDLVAAVGTYLGDGYTRIKCKIEPEADVAFIAAVRETFPDIALTVDANAAYTLADADLLARLDAFDLDYIEQPLAEEELMEHAALARLIETPICLDETIVSAKSAEDAIALGACEVINIKQGRVGGLAEASWTHDVCVEHEIPVWCGGMLETGLGRAANLALASLPGFTMPGDTSPSSRYFHEDITAPFEMAPDGTIAVPTGPGLGVAPLPGIMARVVAEREKVEL